MPSFPHGWSVEPTTSAVLGTLGGLFALGLFMSPFPTFRTIVATRSTGEFDGTPYLVTSVQCLAWVLYASVTPGRGAPLATNAVGLLFEATYTALFLYHSEGARRVRYSRQIRGAALGSLLYLIFTLAVVAANRRSAFVGFTADLLNIAMYSAPLGIMGQVLRTRSVDCMPLSLSLGTLGCAMAWCAYGAYVADVTVLVPNALGVALALAQLALYVRFCFVGRKAAETEGPGANGADERLDGRALEVIAPLTGGDDGKEEADNESGTPAARV